MHALAVIDRSNTTLIVHNDPVVGGIRFKWSGGVGVCVRGLGV